MFNKSFIPALSLLLCLFSFSPNTLAHGKVIAVVSPCTIVVEEQEKLPTSLVLSNQEGDCSGLLDTVGHYAPKRGIWLPSDPLKRHGKILSTGWDPVSKTCQVGFEKSVFQGISNMNVPISGNHEMPESCTDLLGHQVFSTDVNIPDTMVFMLIKGKLVFFFVIQKDIGGAWLIKR